MGGDAILPGLFGSFGKTIRCWTADNQLLPIGGDCKQYIGEMVILLIMT